MADTERGRSGDAGTQQVSEDQGGEEIYRHPKTLGKLIPQLLTLCSLEEFLAFEGNVCYRSCRVVGAR